MATLDDAAHVEADTRLASNISGATVSEVERTCPLCGGSEARLLLNAKNPKYRVVACTTCGMRFTRPLPTEAELAELYTESYYVQNSSRLVSGDTLRRVFQQSVLWQHRRAFVKRNSGRILDVGCGNGEFLASLKARGWDVYGTEFSAAACELARAKGVNVHQGDLSSAQFPEQFFDVVTFWHVFEHLPEPNIELAEVQRILRSDGLLVIEVPNSASLTFRATGADWYAFDVPRHLQHFTPRSLSRLVRNAAFEPIRVQHFHHWDFTYVLYSVMAKLGLQKRLGINVFSTDYKQATVSAQARFALLSIILAMLSLPYSILTALVTRNSESMTWTFRRVMS